MAPGLWTALRLVVGWFSVAIGALDLLAEIGAAWETGYVVFHLVLFAGGIVLLSAKWSTSVPGYVAVAGLVLSALPSVTSVCCMSGFDQRHGYPFSFAARGPGQWQVDGLHLLADLLFWGYLGLIAVALVRLVTQRRGGTPAAGIRHPHAEATAQAEVTRADDGKAGVDTDGTVRGLP